VSGTRVTIVLTEAERDAVVMALGGSGTPPRRPTLDDTRVYLSARKKIRDARVARWGRTYRELAARGEAGKGE
jgi:hypothetical protein